MIGFRQDALRSVGLSPRVKVIVDIAWARAHAPGILVRCVLSWGIVTGFVGCTGDSGAPALSETEEPVATNEADASDVETPSPRGGAFSTPGELQLMPPVDADSIADVKESKAAREAFQVLVTPGSEPAAWETAQKKLVDLGAEAVPVLLRGLKSEDAIEREMAATVCALANSEDPSIQLALAGCLSDSGAFVRANAAAALAQVPEYQPQAIATLTDLLADSDPQLRRMAAANLGSFGEEASTELPKLTAVLTDNDSEVVTPVIQLLGRIGPSAVEAVPQLQKIAFEQDGELKQAAEQALLLIQSDTADQTKPGE